MRNPSLCSIVTNINDGYDTLTMTVNEAIFPVPTESAQSSSSLTAEKVEEERLNKAANMAKKAFNKKEVTKNKKTSSGLLRKFGKKASR